MWLFRAVPLVVEVRVQARHLSSTASNMGAWAESVCVDSLVADKLSAPGGNIIVEVVAAVGGEVSEPLVGLVWDPGFIWQRHSGSDVFWRLVR